MDLRDYQSAAVDACYEYLAQTPKGNPLIVIPTAGGKTLVLATICSDVVNVWHKRVLLLAHVKELLEQSADKLRIIAPNIRFGMYSAGLQKRDTDNQVIIGGIQSVYNKASQLGRFDMIIIDEAHLIPSEGEGRYLTLIAEMRKINPRVKIVGLTATPYRMTNGNIYGKDRIFTDVCYEVGVKELIRRGYISKITTKVPEHPVQCDKFHIKRGEYDQEEVAAVFEDAQNVRRFAADILIKSKDRHHVLIFCSSIKQARELCKRLERESEEECGLITGDTPAEMRAELLARFKGEPFGLLGEITPLRFLVNVSVLTTGFDAPCIDCVVLLRPTASPGLYYQMVGRGFRLSPGTRKTNCLVLDYGGNIQRHGPVDMIHIRKNKGKGPTPVRTCPKCQTVTYLGNSRCPDCGFMFQPAERDAYGTLVDPQDRGKGIISGETYETEYAVKKVEYFVHTKKDAQDAPQTLRVEYVVNSITDKRVKEWVCPEHIGPMRAKFEKWWRQRSCELVSLITTAQRAELAAALGCLATPQKIKVKTTVGKPFPEIVEYSDFTPIPEPIVYTRQVDNGYFTQTIPVKCGECVYFADPGCRKLVRDKCSASSNACQAFSDQPLFNPEEVPF